MTNFNSAVNSFQYRRPMSEWTALSYSVNRTAHTYAGNAIINTPRGHGFAAERANHLFDRLRLQKASLVGGDNAKNGADRLLNGVRLQSKYCASGAKCIRECFDGNGWRYFNPDRSIMTIEVPSNLYDDAVQSMADHIRNDDIPGVSDPKDAAKYVKKGKFTYQQARRIARAGTVESVSYDAVTGAVTAGSAAGLSAALTFATVIWSGEDRKKALEAAAASGLNVGGVAWITSLLSSQASRSGVERSLRPASDWVVNQLGPKAARILATGMRGGRPLYGAAASNHVSKLLRGNVVTSTISVVVLSAGDFYQLFRGRISGTQALKNVLNTTASVAGGAAGATGGAVAAGYAGAAIGTVTLPVIGTVVGFAIGLAGGVLGGLAAQAAAKAVTDRLIEDDTKKMLEIIELELSELAAEYLLNHDEVNQVIALLQEKDLGRHLRDMYASTDRHQFARELVTRPIEAVIVRRKPVKLPLPDEFIKASIDLIDDQQAEPQAAD